MEKLLKKPLLPQNKVSTIIASSEYPQIISKLKEKYSLNVITVPKNDNLEASISTHADCIAVQLDENTLILDNKNYSLFVNYLTNRLGSSIKIITTNKAVQSPYPFDVPLNVKVIGNSILCNTSHVAKEIKEFALNNHIKLLHCNQGYVACSTVLLNDNALITDDESIYHSCKLNGIDCLKISKGSVKLNEHEYGFIGGTCGMIDNNLIAFTGKLSTHKDYELIESYLNNHNINYVELTDGPLIDIGGIIPITELSVE